jgi:hypothetical protein
MAYIINSGSVNNSEVNARLCSCGGRCGEKERGQTFGKQSSALYANHFQ